MDQPDLRTLLQPGARGDQAALFGTRIGQSAAALRELPWTSADYEAEGESRIYREGRVFSRLAGGREEEVPLAACIERAVAGTGWLRVGCVAARIENGLLARLVMSGSSLDALTIRSEGDLVQRFGPPEGVERAYGSVAYHYPSRALVCRWSAQDRKLMAVCLGPDDWREPELTARDLLDQLMAHWEQLEKDRFEPPPLAREVRYYAFMRIAALARAFGVGTVKDLVSGAFIERRPAEDYEPALQALNARYGGAPMAGTLARGGATPYVYRSFLSFRRKAQALFAHNRGVLEASGVYAAAFRATEEVCGQLAPHLALIEDWLARIIDPEQRAFPQSDLIAHHEYPDVDLQQLRIEEEW